MTTIDDLAPSFLTLSPETQLTLIKRIRELRRMPAPTKPRKAKKAASGKKAKQKKQLTLDDALDLMTPEQTKALLLKLQKGKKNG